MKSSNVKTMSLALIAAYSVFTACGLPRRAAAAPAAPGQEKKEEIKLKIRRFEGLDRQGKVLTPEFRTDYSRSSKRGEWCEIRTEYYTYNEWVDNLTFTYYVMTQSDQDGKRGYSFFETSVRYIDIEKGNDHCSTVYLHPKTVERDGWPVAIGVVISAGGKDIAKESDSTISTLKSMKAQDWWKSDAVLKNEMVTKRPGRLLNRSKTPFALINIDDYEVIE